MPQPNLFDLDPEQVSGGPGSARPEIEVDEAVVSSKYQFLKVETSVPTVLIHCRVSGRVYGAVGY